MRWLTSARATPKSARWSEISSPTLWARLDFHTLSGGVVVGVTQGFFRVLLRRLLDEDGMWIGFRLTLVSVVIVIVLPSEEDPSGLPERRDPRDFGDGDNPDGVVQRHEEGHADDEESLVGKTKPVDVERRKEEAIDDFMERVKTEQAAMLQAAKDESDRLEEELSRPVWIRRTSDQGEASGSMSTRTSEL